MHQNEVLMAQLQRQASPTVPQMPFPQNLKIQRPPFPKFYGTPTTKQIFLTQGYNYKDWAYYAGIADWSQTTSMTKQLGVAISADILSSLPQALSSMFLNNTQLSSYRISMLSHLLTQLNPPPVKISYSPSTI